MSISEQLLADAADGFGCDDRDLQSVLQEMDRWLADLTRALDDYRPGHSGLQADSAIALAVQAINRDVQASMDTWGERRAGLEPAQWLADALDDKTIFLVFGKFNAGKSALCNFLADRFLLQGRKVQYFYLEAGQVRDTQDRFCEGATETTARLQGVCLGERLVLLDTPGLHSATDENAALTQRFLHSADAVLWLTSSTSPGQVQELEELAHELRRGKPLLPVITRSDCIEEDEVDGEIRKLLRNKTAPNRDLQETDVRARAQEKLLALGIDSAMLKAPVSVSAYMAREQGQTPVALEEAGFGRLYRALLELAGPALAYKARKPAEVLMHHLEESVLGGLHAKTLPALAALRQTLRDEILALELRQARIVQRAWRSVIPELPRLLDLHVQSQDVEAVCTQLAHLVRDALRQQLREQLGGYDLPPIAPVKIDLAGDTGYVRIASDTAAPPDPGSDAAFVGYEQLHRALESAVQQVLTDNGSKAAAQCSTILKRLDASLERLQHRVGACEQRLRKIKASLQSANRSRPIALPFSPVT